MKNIWTIAQKELRTYFYSPVAYVVLFIFLLIIGFFYANVIGRVSQYSMQMIRFQGGEPQIRITDMIFRSVFSDMIIVLLLLMPLLTMRLLTEERKMKTAELLMTSPVTVTEIILGKFAGAFLLYSLMLGLTFYMPVLLMNVTTITLKPVAANYLGLLLAGGVFLAWGLFASSVTENQIVAAVIGFGMLLTLWIIGFMSQALAGTPMGDFLNYISLITHFENFNKGLIDSSDIVYSLGMIALGLFLTNRVLDSQRWRT